MIINKFIQLDENWTGNGLVRSKGSLTPIKHPPLLLPQHRPPPPARKASPPLVTSRNLRILDVNEITSIPYKPYSPPFIERLIGTIRHDFLDQTLFLNAVDLERKLTDYQAY